jgi:hypothetical protein
MNQDNVNVVQVLEEHPRANAGGLLKPETILKKG